MSLNIASSCAVTPLPLSAGGATPPASTSAAASPLPPDPSAIAGVSGGGSTDLASALAGLQQALAGLAAMLEQVQAQGAAGQGSGAVTGAEGGGAAIGQSCEHCGGDVGQAPSKGLVADAPTADVLPAPAPGDATQGTPPAPTDGAPPTTTPLPGFDSAPLKVKGVDVDPEQRENIKQVLQVGKEMGANRKVLESAVATMIQESTAKNLDTAVDHDSLGLFQQRPSQGWGTPEQVLDPKYAARKYFEKAIESDKGNGGQPMTLLAQSVQRSAFPDAYAKWEGEAKAAVDAFGA